MKKQAIIMLTLLSTAYTSCKKQTETGTPALVYAANGDIMAKIDAFRNRLGTLNTTTGVTSGRREVNWDGVPDALTGMKLPGDFFNPTDAGAPVSRQRGVVYAGLNDAMVSKTGFANVNALAATEFAPFSGDKTFAVINASLWPVEFRVAGQNTPAAVQGFGAVFSDVDKPNSTYLEFFNENRSLGKFYVTPRDAGTGFSFLGVFFPNETITKVQIGHEGRLSDGEKDLTQGGSNDLVVLDDFIYSEPIAR
jgi:hypothetical protein